MISAGSLVRRILKVVGLILLVLVLLLSGMLAWFLRGAIYNRFAVFPQQQAAWDALQAAREPVSLDDGWNEFRGVCHSHSYLSHDSEIPYEDILAAAKIADIEFLFMSDHPAGGTADFSIQWKGMHDGVLFMRGFELSNGLLVWGLPDDTQLDVSHPLEKIAYDVRKGNGLVYFAHSEKDHPFHLAEAQGMEIYNIHSDVLDEPKGFISLLPDMLLNQAAYPNQTMRTFFNRQTEILAKWDYENKKRKMVGIASVDAHRNIGIHGLYSFDEKFQLNENSGKTVSVFEPNFLTRALARLFFGPLEPGKEMFRITKDPYDRSLSFVNDHLLATELTEPALSEALREGRLFIAFDMLCDARGFVYFAESGGRKATMGEEMPMSAGPVLRAEAPVAGRFTVIRDGQPVHTVEGRTLHWTPDQPGKYRLEVELSILGEWTPWIYTNPLTLTAGI
jgi:hypothetical protein